MRHKLIIRSVFLLLILTIFIGGYLVISPYLNPQVATNVEVDTSVIISGNPDEAMDIAKNLYKYVGTSAQDSEQVSTLVNALNFLKFEVDDCKVQSGFLVIDYRVDSRAKYRYMEDYSKNFNQTCGTLFVLCPELRNIRIRVSDNNGEFHNFSRDKASFIYTLGEEYSILASDFENATTTIETFTDFINKLLQIKNVSVEKVYLKQIYEILPETNQIKENTTKKISVVADDNVISILDNLGINISLYKQKNLELYFCNVEDYTTPYSDIVYYLFVFKDQKLVKNDVMSSPELYKQAINLLDK